MNTVNMNQHWILSVNFVIQFVFAWRFDALRVVTKHDSSHKRIEYRQLQPVVKLTFMGCISFICQTYRNVYKRTRNMDKHNFKNNKLDSNETGENITKLLNIGKRIDALRLVLASAPLNSKSHQAKVHQFFRIAINCYLSTLVNFGLFPMPIKSTR